MERLLDLSDKYLEMGKEYYSNAEECIKKDELRKASELLWGAVTQFVKALALLFNVRISKHNDFFNFIRQISEEIGNKDYNTLFLELNLLHRNFYDEEIPPDSFPMFYEKTQLFLEKTKELMRKRQGNLKDRPES
jgi:Archaeal PaREP1/PaREP8 family.